MANVDVPRGFAPWPNGSPVRANWYAVPTAPTINICAGDMVLNDNTGIVSPKLGLVATVYDAAVIGTTIGDEYKILGVVLSCVDENFDPIDNAPSGYIAAARAGDGTCAGYVLVADDPNQRFMAQGDAAFVAADLNLNYNPGSATLCAPNTYTGRSTQEITITGAAVTTTLPLRLYGQSHPQEDVYSAAGCRMICSIVPYCHYYGASVSI